MSKNCDCSFMYGELTEKRTKMDISEALLKRRGLQTEVICYRKDGVCVFYHWKIQMEQNEMN